MLRRAQRSASVSHALPLHAAVREQDMPHAHGSHMDWTKAGGLRSRSPQRRYARLEYGQFRVCHAKREYQAGEAAAGAQEYRTRSQTDEQRGTASDLQEIRIYKPSKHRLIMTALQELRELRNTIKAAEARIDQISNQATEEAVALAPNGGEFTADGHRFQLQKTDVIDMSNYNRYKGEDAVRWRQKKAAQDQSKKYSSALTKEMKGIVEAFVAQHPDWEPDEVKLTVKCLD